MRAFVSYQRADVPLAAHALGYALRLGGHDAFVDTGSIEGGAVFPEAIANALVDTQVMLVLIGPAFDATRLHEPANVVAFEWRRARFHGCAVVPVLVDGGAMPADATLPAELRWITKRNAYVLRRPTFSADMDVLVAAIPTLATVPRRAARVLWVDDEPANNEYERSVLRPRGIVFDNVVSTQEAIEQLKYESYDLVITDMGRRASTDRSNEAGAEFLQHPAIAMGGPPVIVYAGTWAVRRRDEYVALGALDVMSNREHLLDTVLRVLGRPADAD